MSPLAAVEQLDEYTDEEESSPYTDDDEDDDWSESEEEEEDKPVLKYRRFAKEVVNTLHQAQDRETMNVIQCMAVHRKVTNKMLLCASSN